MQFQYTPYTIPLIIAVVVSAIGAGIAWYQREGRTEIYAMWIHIALALWPLTMLLTLSSVSLTWKVGWFRLFVPTLPLLIVSTCLFTFHFIGRSELITPTRRRLLALFPVATLALTLTDGFHGLVLVDPAVDRSGAYALLTYQWGPGMYAIAALSYVIWTGYVALIARKFLRSRNVYRKLSFVILVAYLTVGVAALLSLVGLSPFPHFVLAPLSYVVVGGLLIAGTFSARYIRKLPVDSLVSFVGSRVDSEVPLARDFVVQEVDAGILVLDSEDRVVDINSTAKKMLGLERPVGKHLMTVTRPGWVLEGGELLDLLENEEPVHELEDEVWVRTSRGERCYDVTISALTEADDAADEGAAHIVMMHDITEKKKREERLQEQKEELEFQKRQLERQNERLDKFASIVSHDLRNPLNIVDGHLGLFESKMGDDTETITVETTKIERMQQATGRMEKIIDDALTLARQGKAITDTETVDLATVVADAWANVDTADATLDTSLDTSIVADRDRLLNVLENLFRNAVEHGRDDVTVTVGLLDDRDGFFVADDGPGIPDERKDEVFEHGYTTSSEGTGLGLSIVHDIVGAHGWSVDVTDSADGGARFEITDVRVRPASAAEDTPVAEERP